MIKINPKSFFQISSEPKRSFRFHRSSGELRKISSVQESLNTIQTTFMRAPEESSKPLPFPLGLASFKLGVPQLPEPAFKTHCPPRYFWRPGQKNEKNPFEPSPLLRETKEERSASVKRHLTLYAKENLSLQGRLLRDREGLIYLDISDDYIYKLLPLLEEEKAIVPPFFTYEGPHGAHVPIIRAEEFAKRRGLKKFEELGEKISFSVQGCYVMYPEGWPEMHRVWLLTLHSPELSKLRERYLLPPSINEHSFHVTIAVEREESPEERTYRLNVSCHAV